MSSLSWFLPSAVALDLWGGSCFLPKLAVKTLPSLDIIVYEYVFFFLAALAVLAFYGFHLEFNLRGFSLAMAVGVTGTTGQIFFLKALERGTFSHVSVVTSLYPVVTTALAMLILHETLTLRQGAGIVLGVAAIILLVKSDDR